jgi:hypothetical protein
MPVSPTISCPCSRATGQTFVLWVNCTPIHHRHSSTHHPLHSSKLPHLTNDSMVVPAAKNKVGTPSMHTPHGLTNIRMKKAGIHVAAIVLDNGAPCAERPTTIPVSAICHTSSAPPWDLALLVGPTSSSTITSARTPIDWPMSGRHVTKMIGIMMTHTA